MDWGTCNKKGWGRCHPSRHGECDRGMGMCEGGGGGVLASEVKGG